MTIRRVKFAIWYHYLCGYYGYDFACDCWEALLNL